MNQSEQRERWVAAILESPSDNTLRVVFADWLQENGEPELAQLVRYEFVPRDHLIGRTKLVYKTYRLAASLLHGVIPKTWVAWPVVYPVPPPQIALAEHEDDEDIKSWEYRIGITAFLSYKSPFVVGIRHGFIEAVGARLPQLLKVLPQCLKRHPFHHVAVTGLALAWEHDLIGGNADGSPARVIRRDGNKIPAAVFSRLTPTAWHYGNDMACLYPNQTTAREDLGRALLEWAKEQRQ